MIERRFKAIAPALPNGLKDIMTSSSPAGPSNPRQRGKFHQSYKVSKYSELTLSLYQWTPFSTRASAEMNGAASVIECPFMLQVLLVALVWRH